MKKNMEKYKILIVDDDPMSNAMFRRLFESEYDTRFAENGEEAIEIVNKDRDNPADLILLDILMPGINGFEVCRKLKNDDASANIPVIFITALNNDEDKIEGLELGAVDYITKPFNPAIVKLRVQTQLKLKKERDKIEELTEHLEQLLEHRTAMLELERDIIMNMAEGVSLVEPGSATIIYVNPVFERIFGYDSGELTGKCVFTLNVLSRKSDQIPSNLTYSKPDEISRTLVEKGIWTGDMLNIRKDGTIFWLYSKITGYNHPIYGKIWLGVHEDITDRKTAEESLIASEQQIKLITETITEVFWMADIKIGKMFYISPAYERIWGRTCRSLYENPSSFLDAVHPEDKEEIITELEESRLNRRSFNYEYRIIRPDKSIRWIQDRGFPVIEKTGEIEKYVGIAQDITDKKTADLELDKHRNYLEQLVEHRTAELEEKQTQLLHAAMHDILTGLPTRKLFTDRLSHAVSISKRNNKLFALLYIDLDKFKPVNDDFGHKTGDEALKEAANRLKSCLRDSDTIGRIGGDEFAVIIRDIKNQNDAEFVAQKIVKTICSPILIKNKQIELGASIGISIYPQDGNDPDTLMTKADSAMYSVKKNMGGNNLSFYKQIL